MMAHSCGGCKDLRIEKNMPMRELIKLPTTTSREDLNIYLCEYCDGPAVSLALKNYHRP